MIDCLILIGCLIDCLIESIQEQPNPLKVKTGVYRRPAGFQADMVCLSCWMDGEPPGLITALSVNSAYGLYVRTSASAFSSGIL